MWGRRRQTGLFQRPLSWHLPALPELRHFAEGYRPSSCRRLQLSTASPSIDFTGVSTSTTTAPYIFAGNSFADINGFPLATKTGQELIASDAVNNLGVPLDRTFSLGEVSYSIAPSATLPIAITFSSAGTSLSDPVGFSYAVTTVGGQFATVAPEPSRLGPLAAGLALLALLISHRKPRRAT